MISILWICFKKIGALISSALSGLKALNREVREELREDRKEVLLLFSAISGAFLSEL